MVCYRRHKWFEELARLWFLKRCFAPRQLGDSSPFRKRSFGSIKSLIRVVGQKKLRIGDEVEGGIAIAQGGELGFAYVRKVPPPTEGAEAAC